MAGKYLAWPLVSSVSRFPPIEESFAWADLVDDDIKLYISIFLCVEL